MPYTEYRTTRQTPGATYEAIWHKPRIGADLEFTKVQPQALEVQDGLTTQLANVWKEPALGFRSPWSTNRKGLLLPQANWPVAVRTEVDPGSVLAGGRRREKSVYSNTIRRTSACAGRAPA